MSAIIMAGNTMEDIIKRLSVADIGVFLSWFSWGVFLGFFFLRV